MVHRMTTSPTVIQARVLGTLEVVADGQPVALASSKLRRLLAALLVEAGTVVSTDKLADGVWGNEPPANVTGALQSQVSRLRGRLRAAATETGGLAVLTQAPGYALAMDDDVLDAHRFERLVVQARALVADEPVRAAAMLDDAVALWRGDAYAEFRDETFARFEAARLEELRANAYEERIEAALAQGETDDAIARLELLTGRHPLRERPQAQLMVALYRVGRQADALASYRRYRQLLDDELGLEPSHDLQELERRVLRADADLVRSSRGEAEDRPSRTAAVGDDPTGRASPDRGNVPPPAPLIGRDDVVRDTVEALRNANLVTQIGPGGVGKTSVALHVADAIAADQRDGAWWCELASVDSADAVAQVVMTTLDAQLRPGMGAVSGVVDVLRHRQAMLVLDNAEHVIDGVAELVGAVLKGCPSVRVLVTSRERVGVAGEHVIAVPVLNVPVRDAIAGVDAAGQVPAIALFVRRAAAAGSFELTDANYGLVAEICRRLDGVPLALELAATRMRSMSPEDLVDRLSWRFRVLRGGQRAGAERHRSLQAVVDWSYDLLSERARRVFDRLSVFAGDFTLDAAEQVVGASGGDVDALDVADVVAELVDASMVTAATSSGTGRYALLETIRAYGRERLAASGDAIVVRRAHAQYYAELAETTADGLYRADNRERVSVLDDSFDELRAAHAWSCSNDLETALRIASVLPIYAEQRARGEIGTWAEQAIDAAERAGTDSPWLADAYGAAAWSARFKGDLSQAISLSERAIATASGPEDPACAVALYTLAEVALYEGRSDDVQRLTARLDRVPVQDRHHALRVWARVNIVLAQAYAGAGPDAVAAAEQLLTHSRRGGDAPVVAWALYALAETLVDTDPHRAIVVAEEALATARSCDERFLTGVALVTVGSLNARHGDTQRAVAAFADAVDRWHRAGNWPQMWVGVRSIIGLLVRLGADESAAVLLAALTTRTTAVAPWGGDADRQTAAEAALAERLPPERLEAARAQGAGMRDDEVVAWIRTVLGDLGDG